MKGSSNRKSKFHGLTMKFCFDQNFGFCHAGGHEVLTICSMHVDLGTKKHICQAA